MPRRKGKNTIEKLNSSFIEFVYLERLKKEIQKYGRLSKEELDAVCNKSTWLAPSVLLMLLAVEKILNGDDIEGSLFPPSLNPPPSLP